MVIGFAGGVEEAQVHDDQPGPSALEVAQGLRGIECHGDFVAGGLERLLAEIESHEIIVGQQNAAHQRCWFGLGVAAPVGGVAAPGAAVSLGAEPVETGVWVGWLG